MVTDAEAISNIAANVVRILNDRNWSQRELARRTNETPMAISRICRGRYLPNAAIVARIAEAFDVSVDRLMNEPPKHNSRQSA